MQHIDNNKKPNKYEKNYDKTHITITSPQHKNKNNNNNNNNNHHHNTNNNNNNKNINNKNSTKPNYNERKDDILQPLKTFVTSLPPFL